MVRKLSKTLKNILYSVPIALMSTLHGCEPENEPPTAILEVNPLSVEVPSEIRMKVRGTDPDGVGDIKQYALYIGNESIKSDKPIDVLREFKEEGKFDVYGEVIDSKNQSDKTGVSKLELTLSEGIEQNASLINTVEIEYSAKIKKVPKAELTINKDGEVFLKEDIIDNSLTGFDYSKTFKYNPDGITKGNYEFVLKAGDLEKRTSVNIPNYKPVLDLSGVDKNLEDESEFVFDLSGRASDVNPEDNPVVVNYVKSLDDKTKARLEGSNLNVNTFWEKLGDYQIEIELKNAKSELEKVMFNGKVVESQYKYAINPFVSTNENGAAYDLLKTKAQRDAYVREKLREDWADIFHILPSFPPNPTWVCTEYAGQLMTNFHGNPDAVGYSGFDLDSIYWHKGTLKDNGKYGLPVYFVDYFGTFAHSMNAILTGDDLTKFEDWCFIEPQYDSINVKPGHLYMQSNCQIWIRAPPRNREGEWDGMVHIVNFNVVNGVAEFEQPYVSDLVKVITKRKEE